MGFDNECILNIQSLAGEYFCPVCRLLVYPNEALQSQCTHLYCKPCLTYVVSTTRACPYDGYLVTEADAKPLMESNKALADTIGKIEVHCLYHRSGCTWQGPLSECTSHCSGCAFGSSPVVCNRCGIQIIHREVQEHAQNCPGVQSQVQQGDGAQNAAATGTAITADQNPTASQVGTVTSQAQTSQATVTTTPGQDANQQSNLNPQASLPTSDQWYQQQQYQQYYQQFPGYDPYQQQYQMYYPYQQPAGLQYQQQHSQTHPPQAGQQQPPPQAQPLPQQPPAHSQPLAHAPTAATPQNQAQVSMQQQNHPAVQPHSQIQSQAPMPIHGHPHPQSYSQAQPNQQPNLHPQMPQYQQPNPQMQHPHTQPSRYPAPQPPPQGQPQVQLQNHPQLHPLPNQPLNPNVQPPPQNPPAHAVTGHHSYSQPQPQQLMQPGAPHQQQMHMPPQAGPYRPSQHPVQMQSQFPQQPSQMRPPPQQQPALLPSPGQVLNAPAAHQQPIHPPPQQPGHPVHQRPVMQPVQQIMPQQYVQQPQPFAGQPSGSVQNHLNQQGQFAQQQMPIQSQIRPQAPTQPLHSYAQSHQNVAMSHGMQIHQSQYVGGRPIMPNQGLQSQSQPYPQSAGIQVRPTQPSANQSSASQNNLLWNNNQVKLPTEQLKSTMSSDQESVTDQHMAKKGGNDLDAGEIKPLKAETDTKSIGVEPTPVGEVEEKIRSDSSAKEIPESMRTVGIAADSNKAENGETVIKQGVKEEGSVSTLEPSNGGKSDAVAQNQKDVPVIAPVEHSGLENNELQHSSGLKNHPLQEAEPVGEQHVKLPPPPGVDEYRGFAPAGQGSHLSSSLQQRPGAPILQAPPSHHHTPGPGHSSNQFRPQGSVPGTEAPPGAIPGSGSTASYGRGPSHYGPPQGPNNQGHMPPPHAGALRSSQGEPFRGPPPGTLLPGAFDSHGGMMAKAPPQGQMGQQHPANLPPDLERGGYGHPSGIHSNMMRMNGAQGFDSSLAPGMRDERFKPLADDHLNPFLADPNRHIMDRGEFEEDSKRFPRPSLDGEPKSGSYFSSSRPVDMGSHGFGMDGAARKVDPSRFGPPYRHEDAIARSDPGLAHPDFLGPVPGYGGRRMDGLAPRSPPRDYPGISPHGFGGLSGVPGSHSGLDDIDGRDSHRFGDSYREGRFHGLPNYMRRGEFEGPGNLRMGEHMRSGDLIGQDFLPPHLRRGEHLGPRHMMEDPAGYGPFPGHMRRGELAAPGNFPHHLPPSKSFAGGRPNPRLGEPGFRSSFSLQGFPHDGGLYSGDMDSFDNSRKRKPASMGWCRICKVDCETVEGLDIHSQTREHQQMAMDMVLTIKQNAKKQKRIPRDHSSFEDASKSRNANFGSRGNRH